MQMAGTRPWENDGVKLLEKFEQSIERLMEGTTGSLFNQSIQPAEIGKKLERAMLSQQRVSMGTTIVPNLYVVGLHPKDFAQFADYSSGLSRQMEAWLAQVATQRNLSVVDRIRVSIGEDPSAKRRNPVVAATISDNPGPPPANRQPRPAAPAQATSAFRVEPPTSKLSASLRSIDGPQRGRTFIVPPGSTSVGRSPENDIVLDSPDVSRKHARIECSGSGIRVYDLNSTNGTRVNGDAIRVSDLNNGDHLTFGGQQLVIEFHASDQSRNRGR